jgi:hypothetical protein
MISGSPLYARMQFGPRGLHPRRVMARDRLGQSTSIPFSLPSSFGNGQQFQFNVGGKAVMASFKKIKDLP